MSLEKKLVSEIPRFILPFSSKENTSSVSDKDLTTELAAIFALSEKGREKPGRILSRGSNEKITFISKIGYPLWLFSLADDIFLFDGLNTSEYNLTYATIAPVNDFLEGLKSSSRKRESYASYLAQHTEYFDRANKESVIQLKGLIAESEMLNEFSSHRYEASGVKDQLIDIGLLSSPLNESRIKATIHEIVQLKAKLEKDIDELHESIDFLGKSLKSFHHELQDEIDGIKHQFALEISEEEAAVAPIVRNIRREYDDRIISLTKMIEKEQVPLHKEKLRLTNSQQELNRDVQKYNTKSRSLANEEEKDIWEQKIEDAKDELCKIDKQLEKNEHDIKTLDKKRESDTLRYKSELETEIKVARKKILDLEGSRESKILVVKEEMEKLSSETKHLIDQLDKLVKLREADISQVKKLSIKPDSEELDKALVYLPFYIIRYGKDAKNRYVIVSPSTMGTMALSTKLKGALGGSRIKSLFTPRFKQLNHLAENIQEQNKKNSVFEQELKTLGTTNNILTMTWIRDEIESGLLTLKQQGWLNDKEYGAAMESFKTTLKPL